MALAGGMCVCESVFAREGVVVKKSCQQVLSFTHSRYLTVIIFILNVSFLLFFFLSQNTAIMVSNMFLGKEALELTVLYYLTRFLHLVKKM